MPLEIDVRGARSWIASRPFTRWDDRLKFLVYAILVGAALYWGWTGHLLYGWDELLSVAGFGAIEWNPLDACFVAVEA